MRKVLIILLAVLGATFALSAVASAAPEVQKGAQVGPYNGTFNGRVYGDKGSSAPLTLKLTHVGSEVSGTIFIGEGLYVDAGFCGGGYIPASTQVASGRTVLGNPKRLSVDTVFEVEGYEIGVVLDSSISVDGKTLEADAQIDLPWLCGRDPVLSGTLHRSV